MGTRRTKTAHPQHQLALPVNFYCTTMQSPLTQSHPHRSNLTTHSCIPLTANRSIMRPAAGLLLWAFACLRLCGAVVGFVPPSTYVRRPAPAPAARAAARAGSEGNDNAAAPSRPPVVAVIGHPGSGQTTFARCVDRKGWDFLVLDSVHRGRT